MLNRRVLSRVPLDAEVIMRLTPDGQAYDGLVKNISAGGILIAAKRSFPNGTVLLVEVMAEADREAGLDTPLRAELEVRHVEGENPFLLGTQFLHMTLP